jgi:TonB-linked SusC/RagA family outer membrane protein
MRLFLISFCIMLFATFSLKAQNRNITGQILSTDKSEPLIGVSVIVKGTTTGSATDADGKFSIAVPSTTNVTLVVKYLGFKQQEVTVGATQQNVNIRLAPEATSLDEVVVIGFGQVKKRDLTAAVSVVKSEDIVQNPTQNPLEAIAGKAPGVDIVRTTGNPGSNPVVAIRGHRSINGSSNPLYIIDGVQGANPNDLNSYDIDNIEVLKDASATAIYGSQGANGVIIITTKRGTTGKPKVAYNSYYGVNGMPSYPTPRSGDSYIALRQEAYRAAGQSTALSNIFNAAELNAIGNNQWVNYVDLLSHNSTQQSHTLSVSGGSDKTKAFASVNYYQENGTLKYNNLNRYNARLNIDHTVSKWFKTGVQAQVSFYNTNNRKDPWSTTLTTEPLGTPYDANGGINVYPLFDANGIANKTSVPINPLTDERGAEAAINNTQETNIFVSPYLEITPMPIKGLTYRSNFGTTITNSRQGVFYDPYSLNQYANGVSSTSETSISNKYYTWDNILTYSRQFGPHSFTATAVSTYTNRVKETYIGSGTKQLLGSQLFYNLGATDAASRTLSSAYIKQETMAYVGRLSYNYKGKYLVEASERYDGSSILSAGHKWHYFPAASAAWNISEESFLKDVKQISQLKLRASYGLTGNAGLGAYATQSTVSTYPMGFGDNAAAAYQFNGTVGNLLLGWEMSKTFDIGTDISLFRDRIGATIDWYNTNTTGILYTRSLPQSTGQTSVSQNVGTSTNKGIEIALNTRNIQTKNFQWNSTLTFTANNEKLTSVINGSDIIATSSPETNSLLVGHPIASFYSYKKLGVWQTSDAAEAATYTHGGVAFKPGDIKLADLNGDHIIDTKDQGYVGGNVPKWTGGFQNTFKYKNFDLTFYLLARWGQTINAQFVGRFNPAGTGNGPANFDYWTPENATNDFPRPLQGASISSYYGYQSLNFIDGSYLKLRNATLGYTLPASVAKKIMASRIRVYGTTYNIYTYTKNKLLKGYDPEANGAESAPLTKSMVFGLNVEF